jgi:hypothetical protein
MKENVVRVGLCIINLACILFGPGATAQPNTRDGAQRQTPPQQVPPHRRFREEDVIVASASRIIRGHDLVQARPPQCCWGSLLPRSCRGPACDAHR